MSIVTDIPVEASMFMQIMGILIEVSVIVHAVAAVVLAIFTIALWAATRLLVQENRKSRKEAKRPRILAKLKPLPEHGEFIQLILNNAGRGLALNVTFRLEGIVSDFERHEMPLRGTLQPIRFISPAESEVYEIGAKRTLFSEPRMKPFTAVINYEDVDGRSHNERSLLDVSQFDGLAWQGTSVSWRSMKALENIAKLLGTRVQRRTDTRADVDVLASCREDTADRSD